jgi:hypothetical protein
VSRKFQTGKLAKKSAEEIQIRNAYLRSLEGQNKVAEVVDPQTMRPSLMDEHLAKRVKVDHGVSKVRQPFDRDQVIDCCSCDCWRCFVNVDLFDG